MSLSLNRTLLRVPLVSSSSASLLRAPYFSTSSIRSALKEGDANREGDQISHKYEPVKREELRGAKEGKNTWKIELASESEASVKADRGETGIPQEAIEINKKEKKTQTQVKGEFQGV